MLSDNVSSAKYPKVKLQKIERDGELQTEGKYDTNLHSIV